MGQSLSAEVDARTLIWVAGVSQRDHALEPEKQSDQDMGGGTVGTILRLSAAGPMPHKDLIIPPVLAGLAEWTDSGLSIFLPLFSSGDSPPASARAKQFKGNCCFGEPLWESH